VLGVLGRLMARGNLAATIRRFVMKLQREHALEIERDARGFKRRAVSCFRRFLPPGAGRPCDEAISRADDLRGAGRPWREIYQLCVPGFSALDSTARQVAQSRLRSAVRSRRNIRRRRERATG
jgi:hypothetical protein